MTSSTRVLCRFPRGRRSRGDAQASHTPVRGRDGHGGSPPGAAAQRPRAGGRGARLTQVQVERGGSWVLAQTEPGDRTDERRLKQHGAARRCGVCKAADGYQSGQLTAAEALTRAGWDRASQHERGLLLDMFGLSQAPENLPARPGPRPEMPAPRPGPASREVRVIPAPRPAPDAHYQVTPEVVALVDQLEAAWAPSANRAAGRGRTCRTGGRVVSDLHHRSTLDDAFCEWLLSDHPEAKAERDWRRGSHLRQLRQSAADIAGWADRVSADPGQHTPMARDLAATIGPMAHASAIRAEIEAAEPDDPTSPASAPSSSRTCVTTRIIPTWITATPPT